MFHHGDAEGVGLAGAGGGLGHHVPSLHEVGDGTALDGGGLGEALFVQGLHNGLGQVHIFVKVGILYHNSINFHGIGPFYLVQL